MPSKIKFLILFIIQNYKAGIRKLKMRLQIEKRFVVHLNPTISCDKKWYGSIYGGFYINPNFICPTSVIYSFGIGTDITFDTKCIQKHNCKVYGFDPTPKSIKWIKSINHDPKFIFYDFGISTISGMQTFYLPYSTKGTSGSLKKTTEVDERMPIQVKMKSFIDITQDLQHPYIDVIKMDIEGAEYEVLNSIIDSGIPFGQLLIEFHDRLYEGGAPMSYKIVGLLKEKGYEIFAHSINYEEISFINKSLLLSANTFNSEKY
jgi:FkbM family methyltransferase